VRRLTGSQDRGIRLPRCTGASAGFFDEAVTDAQDSYGVNLGGVTRDFRYAFSKRND